MDNGTEPRAVASGTKTRRRPHQECFLMLEEFGGTTPACAFIPLATARGSVPSHHLSEFLYKTSRLNLQYFLGRAFSTLNCPMNSADVTHTRCFAREEQLVVEGF